MTTPLQLFLTVDHRQACLLAPMMMSVLEHAVSPIAFRILGDSIPPHVADAIIGLVRRHAPATVAFHDMSGLGGMFAGCTRGWFGNDVVFLRLMIPEHFPEIDQALYMDVDTLALRDVGEIMEIGTGHHGIAAAPDMGLRYYVNVASHHERLGIPSPHVYFNNGVLLIDCRWWRRERALDDILSIAKRRRHDVRFPTQDPMNLFFSPNRYHPLSKRYNCMPFAGQPPADAAVLHFAGEKPWEDPSIPSATPFFSYVDRSPLADDIRALTVERGPRRAIRRGWRCAKRAWQDIVNGAASRRAAHG